MSLPTYSADAMHSVDHFNVAPQLQEESQKDEMAKGLFMFLQQGKVSRALIFSTGICAAIF